MGDTNEREGKRSQRRACKDELQLAAEHLEEPEAAQQRLL